MCGEFVAKDKGRENAFKIVQPETDVIIKVSETPCADEEEENAFNWKKAHEGVG